MKLLSIFFRTITLMVVFAFSSSAQSTASANVSATIVVPLTLTHNGTDMDFGNISANPTTGGTVNISPGGIRTTGGAGVITLPNNAGSVSAAVFEVSGQSNYTYSVILPQNCTLTHTNNSDMMTVSSFTSSPSTAIGAGVLNANGLQTLYIGATLNVAANQNPGVYASGTAFTVTVNYN